MKSPASEADEFSVLTWQRLPVRGWWGWARSVCVRACGYRSRVLIGAHVSASGGLDQALVRMQEIGAEAVQLFVQSPRTWRPTNHRPETIERFKAERARLGAPVFAHALYLVNLASPNEELYRKSVETMCTTMDVACAIEADGVIFHVGSHQGTGFEGAVERVGVAMEEILGHANDRTWLLMENSAGAGGTIGRSLEELAALFERLGRHPSLGLCLDSCHLWVSGWDVTERAELDHLVAELDRADRRRALARAARQRRQGAARLQPRPAREHRRGDDGREARRLSLPSGLRKPARAARNARS